MTSPHELWEQAGGDPEKYRALMRQHGHIIAMTEDEKARRLACVEHAKVHEVRSYHPDSVAAYIIGHAVLYPGCEWRAPLPEEPAP